MAHRWTWYVVFMADPITVAEPTAVDALESRALHLDERELLDLMGRLLQAHHRRSSDRGEDEEFLRAWGGELQRRSAELRSGEERGVPAEDVIARLRAELEDDDRERPVPSAGDS